MSAPLSSPLPFTCSHCGFGWSDPAPACPRCGQEQTAVSGRKVRWGRILLNLAFGLLFGLLGVVWAAMGVALLMTDPLVAVGLIVLGVLFAAGGVFFLQHAVRGLSGR